MERTKGMPLSLISKIYITNIIIIVGFGTKLVEKISSGTGENYPFSSTGADI